MIPSLGAITMADSLGSASYHGLQTTMDKRLSQGWQGSLSYTWSHSIDNVPELAGGEGNMVIQDWRNLQGDRGNSGFDRRHRLVAHAAVDLPFGAGRRSLQRGGPLGVPDCAETIADNCQSLLTSPFGGLITAWFPSLDSEGRGISCP